jgi:two-component system phosphate regulon sensor histidine kinase PhoR
VSGIAASASLFARLAVACVVPVLLVLGLLAAVDSPPALRETWWWVLVGGCALALLTAGLTARAIGRPLALLRQQVADLAADPAAPTPPAPLAGPREVVQLAEALDRLARAVRASLRRVGAERDRLDAVLANLADGVVLVDSEGRVVRLNPAAERLLGLSVAQATERTTAEVLRDHELVQLVDAVRQGSPARPLPSTFVEWGAPRRFLRAAASRFGSGDEAQTLLLLQDLTELRRLETVRRDFVANVSHELRTPIAAIKAMAETLRDGAIDDPAAAADFLARIDEEVEGLHQIVEELLELSRLESGAGPLDFVPTDPTDLVEDAVRRLAPLAARASVTLEAELPDAVPPVLADAERLRRVLVSVIHNAIKFTPPGGSIVVRLDAADGVRITVADTGVGIAPELLPRVFERFYKADAARAGGGTGLGLAIAKHTVQLHGGTIWAESEGPGRGTTVQIHLPATPVETEGRLSVPRG